MNEVKEKKKLSGIIRAVGISALMVALSSTFTACSGDGSAAYDDTAASEDILITEGVDTPVTVTGFSRYSGAGAQIFLKTGDKIAVISPSALPTREQTDATIEGLKKWGYVPVEGKYVCTQDRTVDNCREDLEWALTDPEIKGIFCVRGGYASCEVMEVMNRDLIAEKQKPIIGYSDITACHSGWSLAGVPSVHASMSAAFTDLPKDCADIEEKMLQGEVPSYKCAGSEYDRQGSAEGILIGGNLTILMTTVSTAFDSTKISEPYILFLEDVECDYHQVHYELTVLKNLGILENAAGIILGEWTDTNTETGDYVGDSRGGRFKSVYEMMHRQFLKDLDIPIAYGFPAGHGENNYPLLMGAKVRLNVGQDEFTLEWAETK